MTFVSDVGVQTDLGGGIEQFDERHMAAAEVFEAAVARVAGVLRLAEAAPRPAGQARSGAATAGQRDRLGMECQSERSVLTPRTGVDLERETEAREHIIAVVSA